MSDSMQSRRCEQFNVKDFGAKGDGVHADRDPIQRAIDAASKHIDSGYAFGSQIAGSVFIPPGAYSITGTLEIPRYVELIGDSMNATVLKHEGGSVPCINMFKHDEDVDMVSNAIKDLTIYGTSDYGTSAGIDCRRGRFNCLIQRVRVYYCNIGIRLGGSWTFTLENNHVSHCREACLKWDDAIGGMMYSNRFERSEGHCVHIKRGRVGSIDLCIFGNLFQFSGKSGLLLEDVHSANLLGNYFEGNNTLNRDLAQLDILLGTEEIGTNYLIQGGYITPGSTSGDATKGIRVEKAEHVQISGVHMSGRFKMAAGIQLGDKVRTASIISNRLYAKEELVSSPSTSIFRVGESGCIQSAIGRSVMPGTLSVQQSEEEKALHVTQGAQAHQAIIAGNTNPSFANVSVISDVRRPASRAFRFFEGRSGVPENTDVEFQVSGEGDVLCDGVFSSSGSGHAEYFEWYDGNPNDEDRTGIAVVMVGNLIQPARKTGERHEIVGVTSAVPAIAGGSADLKWHKRYLRDDRNLPLLEERPVGSLEKGAEADGSVVRKCRKLNPDFEPARHYSPRSRRKEWALVCLLGRVRLRPGQPKGKRWVWLRKISIFDEYLVR